MLQSAVLLCPPAEARPLAAILAFHNPALAVTAVAAREDLEEALARAPGARLIAFATSVIVPRAVLEGLAGPAYNFHPGPPAYPGKHPLAFALYDAAERYGATLHEMAPRVDSGPIVAVLEFPVSHGTDHIALGERTYRAMMRLFLHMAPALAASPYPLPRADAAWGGRECSQKALEAMCALPPDIDRAELERRERAFGWVDGAALHLRLHGRRFDLRPAGR